tara:strand:- start:980 stop:1594 length:615 start_codon:yes stop_codon:yes gene_type:complete
MIEEFDSLYVQVYGQPPGTNDPVYHGSQIKGEFIRAWNELIGLIQNTEGTFTFLEVGAYRGLWPLMLSFVCERLNKDFIYTTVTWLEQDPNNEGIHKVQAYYESKGLQFNLVDKNSQLPETLEELEDSYHVTFIDADHRYEGVKKDIEIYSSLATKLLMFHDIRPKDTTPNCGVYQAIEDCGITLDEEIVVDGQKMGIGFKWIV